MTLPGLNIVELPLDSYEKVMDLQRKILNFDIDPALARYEMIELMTPYMDHIPEPWEKTEIRLKKSVSSIITRDLIQ